MNNREPITIASTPRTRKYREEQVQADVELEQNALSCLIYQPAAIAKVADTLQGEHFYREGNALVYSAMLALYQQGIRCTVMNVADELERKHKLEHIIGHDYITGYDYTGRKYLDMLANSFVDLDDVEDYARRLMQKATGRRLKFAALEIAKLAESGDDDAAEQALALVESIALGADWASETTFADAIDAYLTDLRKRRIDAKNGIAHGLSTGFADLDRMLGGLQPACLITLGALTGAGKSAFALNVALNIALQAKHVAFFSLEMRAAEIVQRALSIYAELDQSLLRDGLLNDEEMRAIEAAARKIRQCDIKLDDHSFSINAVCSKAKRMHSRKKLGLIAVDYVQLLESMESRNKNMNRAQEVAELSRRLKRLAQELNVPVLALVQLNRKVEDRNIEIPKLSDINESGGIARDSDIVMFIYSTKEELEKRDKNMPFEVNVKVAKNRSGRMGDIPLTFNPRITKFREMSLEDSYGAE